MDDKEANKVIAKKLMEAEALIRECEKIADEHKLGFSWDLAYGMGGWYSGNPEARDAYSDSGWSSSSSSC